MANYNAQDRAEVSAFRAGDERKIEAAVCVVGRLCSRVVVVGGNALSGPIDCQARIVPNCGIEESIL